MSPETVARQHRRAYQRATMAYCCLPRGVSSRPQPSTRQAHYMTRFVIHIGMHKTGTTSIQAALYRARKALAKRGVLYPEFGPNHSHPLVSMFHSAPLDYYVNFYSGLDTPAKVDAFNQRHRDSLETQLSAREWDTVLLSGEELGTGLGEDELREFRKYCDRRATSYCIVCYVRDPIGFATSAIQQQVQAGLTLEELYEAPPRVRYRDILEKYINVFGSDKIQLRAYAALQQTPDRQIDDFLHTINAPHLGDCVKAIRPQNTALRSAEIHALSLYNRHVPPNVTRDGTRRANPDRPDIPTLRTLLAEVADPTATARFSLPSAVAHRVLMSQYDDIQWLRARIARRPARTSSRPSERLSQLVIRPFRKRPGFGSRTDFHGVRALLETATSMNDSEQAPCHPRPVYTQAHQRLMETLLSSTGHTMLNGHAE